MTERDEQLSDGFLVDGVAPSVIGGQESPEPPVDDYEESRPAGQREGFRPGTRREPPTTPIPAQNAPARTHGQAAQPQPEQRKGWLGRMFGGPSN